MNKQPLVSVIIPSYNRADLLPRAIQSALDQTHDDFEMLIVDDASSDDTASVMSRYTESDPRVRYVRLERNSGAAEARNVGIGHSRGRYLAFLDSDDEWRPRKLEKQLAFFNSPEADGIGLLLTDVRIVEDDGKVQIKAAEPTRGEQALIVAILNGSFGHITCSSWVVDRSAFRQLPLFDSRFVSGEDKDYMIRVGEVARIENLPEALVTYHNDHPDHLFQKNTAAPISGKVALIEKHGELLRRYPRTLSRQHHMTAMLYKKAGEVRPMRHHLLEAIKAFPVNGRLYFQYLRSFL